MDDTILNETFRGRILNGLVEAGVLTEEILSEAHEVARNKMKPIEDVLVEEGFISRERLENFIEKYLELPKVDLSSYVPDPEALKYVPKNYVHRYLILPLFEIEGVLTIAVANPLTLFKLDEISSELNISLDPVLATENSLIDAIIVYYGVTPDEIGHRPKYGGDEQYDFDEEEIFKVDLDRLAIIEGEAVNQLLGEIFTKAKKAGARAVHIEPLKGDFQLLFRVNDELIKVGEAARSLQRPLLDQIKYLARIPKNERLPQEKIADFPRAGEVLVSIYPSVYGERVVVSFLKDSIEKENLEDYNFDPEEIKKIHSLLENRNGLIVIGAPIQSGKTSLLRTMLKLKASKNKSAFLLGPAEIKPVSGVQFQKLRGEELLSAIEGIAYQDML